MNSLVATSANRSETPSFGLFQAIHRGAGTGNIASTKYLHGLEVPQRFKLTVVLCPIYDPASKDLGSSFLISDPNLASLQSSRVGKKLEAYTGIIREVNDFLRSIGSELSLEMIFADRGVIRSRESDNAGIVTAHSRLYEDISRERFGDNGIRMRFRRFGSLDSRPVTLMPQFIDTNVIVPKGVSVTPQNFPPRRPRDMRRFIIQHLAHFGVPAPVSDHGDSLNVLATLMAMQGISPATNISLIGTYIAATQSFMDSDICGPDGMYLDAERFKPLLRIPEMVPALKDLQRIDVQVGP